MFIEMRTLPAFSPVGATCEQDCSFGIYKQRVSLLRRLVVFFSEFYLGANS